MPDPVDVGGRAIPASQSVAAGAGFVENVAAPVFCDVCGTNLRTGDRYLPSPPRHAACNDVAHRSVSVEAHKHTRS